MRKKDAGRRVAAQHGFEEYDAPVLETEALYIRKAGEDVTQQLYSMEDRSGRRLSLRPEMTPSLARMVLGRRNALNFRLLNTRFDVVGGVLYFLVVASVVPRCGDAHAVLDATSPVAALAAIWRAVLSAAGDIVAESAVSLTAVGVLFTLCLAFAGSGGVGAAVTREGDMEDA